MQTLVLDTNVVLDLVVFDDPGVQRIAQAIGSGAAMPVASRACLEELRRVLEYPRLKLGAAAQREAFERFRSQAALFEVPAAAEPEGLPLCADPDDQKFLELAWHARAHCLVTRDKALLDLARAIARLGGFAVVTPEEFDPDPALSFRIAPGLRDRAR